MCDRRKQIEEKLLLKGISDELERRLLAEVILESEVTE